jgi:large subunit ribosomal protein L19
MATTKKKHRRRSKNAILPPKGLAGKVASVEQTVERMDFPHFTPGDTVRVHVRIKEGEKERTQAFEGIVVSRAHQGASKSFIVRKISHGVGVERIFMESSPKVAKLEVVQEGRVRRAKLYYLRKLEGKAARVDREIETQAAAAQSAAATAANAAANAKKNQ